MRIFRAETKRGPSKETTRAQRRFEQLEQRRLLAAAVVEQEFVYLLNRARHDPAAFEQEQNLPVDLSSVVARGPLAINSQLISSSQVKATDMATNDYFSHVSPGGVYANQLVTNAGYQLPSYFETRGNGVESLAAGSRIDTAIEVLNLLIIDEGVPGAGHRRHLLGIGDFYGLARDVGVGYASSVGSSFTNYWAAHLGMRAEPKQLLTGVVFDDANGDSRYNAGEGLSGVTITVDGTLVTSSNESGGWSLVADAGEHTISASGGGFVGHSTANATVGGENVAVDFISGDVAGQVSFEKVFGTNVGNTIDVNSDGAPSVIDALTVINHIGVSQDGGSPIYGFDVYLDANGDGKVSVIDALQVINGLALLENGSSGELLMASMIGSPAGESTIESGLAENPVSILSTEAVPVEVSADPAAGELSRSERFHSFPSQRSTGQSAVAKGSHLVDLALLSLDLEDAF